MKNDLDSFEKNLLKVINLFNRTKYNHKNLMEWNSNEDVIKSNLEKGEKIYNVCGVYVAIKVKSNE